MICVDDYGNEIVTPMDGFSISFAHDIVIETAGSRKQAGLNWRGPYHYKCTRCQHVWLTSPQTKCYPHNEMSSGNELGYMHKASKQIDMAFGYLYRQKQAW